MLHSREGNVSTQMKDRGLLPRLVLTGVFSACLLPGVLRAQVATAPQKPTNMDHASALLSQAELAAALPPSVFFRGKVAPVQMRNGGGMRWPDGSLFWAVMVDASGYASNIQETYQFFLVTEQPVKVGGQTLPPGEYGAGFVAGKFLVQDVGGHTLLSAPVENDAAMQRPRPLQVVAAGPEALKLYLGRHWVQLQLAHR